MKIATVLGTRPEIIRLSQVIPKLDKACEHILIHTGQSYDANMSDIFFDQLEVRKPDHYLGIHGNYAEQISTAWEKCRGILAAGGIERLLVLGDTNSALMAFVAKRLGIRVYHMEAGNRCYDDRTPEEVNRRVIDACSDVWMPYSERSRQNLLREGKDSQHIYVVGNPIFEVLSKVELVGGLLESLKVEPSKYFSVTAHREENVDDKDRLRSLLNACTLLIAEYNLPIVFSTHPRTAQNMKSWGFDAKPVIFHTPFGFQEFNTLAEQALCVLTDSGTVQEECCIKRVRCVTLRDNTERPETIECGSNILAGVQPGNVQRCVKLVLSQDTNWDIPLEYMWDNVSDKVVRIVTGI